MTGLRWMGASDGGASAMTSRVGSAMDATFLGMASIVVRTSPKTGKTSHVVQFRDPETGRGRSRSFPTAKLAAAFRAKVEVAIYEGTFTDPARAKVTVGELIPAWVRSRAHLAENTVKLDANLLKKHVRPRWEHVQLRKITRRSIQDWVHSLTDSGLASGTVRKCHSILRALLKQAVRDELIARNVAEDIDLPQKTPAKQIALSARQIRMLLENIRSERFREFALLLVTTGLRYGEAAALTVGDVDFTRGTLSITKAATTIDARVTLGPTKTRRDRTVSVPPVTLEVLAHRAAGRHDTDLLFPNRYGQLRANDRNDWLREAVAACRKQDPAWPKEKFTIHSLRHVATSLMLAQGVGVRTAMSQLGHSDPHTTLVTYAAVHPDDLGAVGEAVGGALSIEPPIVDAEEEDRKSA